VRRRTPRTGSPTYAMLLRGHTVLTAPRVVAAWPSRPYQRHIRVADLVGRNLPAGSFAAGSYHYSEQFQFDWGKDVRVHDVVSTVPQVLQSRWSLSLAPYSLPSFSALVYASSKGNSFPVTRLRLAHPTDPGAGLPEEQTNARQSKTFRNPDSTPSGVVPVDQRYTQRGNSPQVMARSVRVGFSAERYAGKSAENQPPPAPQFCLPLHHPRENVG